MGARRRVGWIATWLLLVVSIVAPILYVVFRSETPSDGARVDFYGGAWSALGVTVRSADAGAGPLRDGDIVVAVAGRRLESWAQAATWPAERRPNADRPQPYVIVRGGSQLAIDVAWTEPRIGGRLAEGWGLIVFCVAFVAIAAFVFKRAPDEPGAVPLVLMASAAAGSSVPWFLGVTVSDVVQGAGFVVHSVLTGALYMLLYPAGVHLSLVFPTPHPLVTRRPWLVPAVYAVGLGGYAGALLVGLLLSPTALEWIGTWSVAQLAIVVPLLVVMLGLIARRYAADRDPMSRARIRSVALGATISGAVTLAVYWIPELVLGRPLLDFSWLGILVLPFPAGLAIGIMRHRLFDIDVVFNRALVYGGLTLGVVIAYAAAAAVLTAGVGPEHGQDASVVAAGLAALAALPLRDVLQRSVNRLLYGHRDEPWRAMHRLGQRLEWAGDQDRLFLAVAETVADSLRLPYVAVAVVDDTGSEGVVAEHGVRQRALRSLPLLHGAERVGHLALGVRAGEDGFREDELRLLGDLGRQAGVAIGAIRLRADLARSRERLVIAREEERRRLRRDLHDGLGPSLAAIGMRAEAASAVLTSDPPNAADLLAELSADVQVALADVRRLVDGLRPPALDELGLVAAIEQQAERLERGAAHARSRVALAVEVNPTPLPELPAAVEVAAYRIAVEALTNAVRHSGARTCRVRIDAADVLTVEIIDDGRGLPLDVVPGIGLESIRARADELGGVVRLERIDSAGTRVVARLPLGAVRQ